MFKKYRYTTERELEGLRWTARVIDFGVSLTVMTALNELTTACGWLRDRKDIYRREIKRRAKIAEEKASIQKAGIFSVMRNKGFFDTYCDKVIDLAEQDITLFRLSIKQTLDDNQHCDTNLISYIETARTMLSFAHAHFDKIIETARTDFGYDYSKAFSEFNVADVHNAWETLCNMLYSSKSDINLNTERSLAFFESMGKKFAEGDYVQACLHEAETEYPEFTNEIILKDDK